MNNLQSKKREKVPIVSVSGMIKFGNDFDKIIGGYAPMLIESLSNNDTLIKQLIDRHSLDPDNGSINGNTLCEFIGIKILELNQEYKAEIRSLRFVDSTRDEHMEKLKYLLSFFIKSQIMVSTICNRVTESDHLTTSRKINLSYLYFVIGYTLINNSNNATNIIKSNYFINDTNDGQLINNIVKSNSYVAGFTHLTDIGKGFISVKTLQKAFKILLQKCRTVEECKAIIQSPMFSDLEFGMDYADIVWEKVTNYRGFELCHLDNGSRTISLMEGVIEGIGSMVIISGRGKVDLKKEVDDFLEALRIRAERKSISYNDYKNDSEFAEDEEDDLFSNEYKY